MAAGGEQSASRDALTPAFSAPESFRGEEPTALADIYSLAATLYALLAGRPPRFAADGKTPSLATIMSLHDKPVDDVPGVPPEFTALLRRSLSADPAARPQTAAAFRDALIGLDSHTGPARYAAAQYAGSAQYASPARHPRSGRYPGPVHLGESATDPTGSRSHAGWTGPGPDPSSEPGKPTLAENPTVRAVCSMPVLLASRRVAARQIPSSSWQIEVLPPTEAAFDSGARTFRCVANVVGTQSSTSQFRR